MDWDDMKPKTAAAAISIGETLETLSLAELTARIGLLEKEIERVRAELERKRAHEAAAAALFKR